MNYAKEIKDTLKTVMAAVNNNTYKENAVMIDLQLGEAILTLRTMPIPLKIAFAGEDRKHHIPAVKARTQKGRYTALSDLTELRYELNKKRPSLQRCIAIIETLLETDLHLTKPIQMSYMHYEAKKFETKHRHIMVEGVK